jgi:quercetin dioxygenase-like cupin family protein
MLTELSPTATSLDEAPAYWFLNNLHIVLARSQSTRGAYSLVHLTAGPDFATPYHLHHAEDEAFYVLEGEITVICDGKKIELQAGGYVFLPRQVPHGFRCSSKTGAKVLIHVMPGTDVGFVGMMLQMSTEAKRPFFPEPVTPDFERLKAACKDNQIDLLGPLPE